MELPLQLNVAGGKIGLQTKTHCDAPPGVFEEGVACKASFQFEVFSFQEEMAGNARSK
ncbi:MULTISPECIES: hypothetical protein [Pirellulaceae]|uniref:hypothetical protein n=1 Tax=Pirellulaceae TaxID=2691357 RepID=UPI001304A0B5|nr:MULTISPECIES: hypothetical protein [Pirellulaceae]